MKQLFIIIMLMTMLSMSVMAFNVSIDYPRNGQNMIGTTQLLNATVGYTSSSNENVTNLTWRVLAANTGNSTLVQVCQNVTVVLGNLVNFTCIFNSVNLQDANSYVVNVTATNSSGADVSAQVTGAIVDNTVPQISTLTSGRIKDDLPTISMTGAASNFTNCTLEFVGSAPNSYTTTTAADSSGTCSIAFTQRPASGDYTIRMTANDGTNQTLQTQQVKFAASGSASLGTILAIESQNQKAGDDMIYVVGAVIAVLILIGVGTSKRR